MEANILDLRYHMKKVLQALDRNEPVTIFYHGKIKGTIVPAQKHNETKVSEHPLFGMHTNTKMTVEEQMNSLRDGRYHDI